MVRTYRHEVASRGESQVVDLTPEVLDSVEKSGVKEGTVTVFVPGSTAGVTTIEYEPGCVRDITDCFERIAPRDLDYGHEQAWHDGNGHSHVRASLLGPSIVVPISDGHPVLGTWQQVILIDFDNKSRRRVWTATVIGE